MLKSILAATLLSGLVASAIPADAQAKCGPRDAIVNQLGAKFGEHMIGGGLTSPTRMIEIWTSGDGATWTVLMTDAGGQSCIVAAGRDWVDFPENLPAMMNGTAS